MMKSILHYESPIIQVLSRLADLFVLNVCTVLCCIPLVTIGAAVTALYAAVDALQNDDGHIYRKFFSVFCSSLKQATALWLIVFLTGAVIICVLGFYYFQQHYVPMIVCLAAFVFWLCAASWVFPLAAISSLSVKEILSASIQCAIAYLPRTIVMAAMNVVPAFTLLEPIWLIQASPVLVSIWFALSANWIWKLLSQVIGCWKNERQAQY